jgi:hypothetical protein
MMKHFSFAFAVQELFDNVICFIILNCFDVLC